jgi:hypothetical protein
LFGRPPLFCPVPFLTPTLPLLHPPPKKPQVRGLEGVREATITLAPGANTPFYALLQPGGAAEGASAPPPPPPLEVRVAVCNGLGNAKKLIKEMSAGERRFDFVEV